MRRLGFNRPAPTPAAARRARGRCTRCGAHAVVVAGAKRVTGVCPVCGGKDFEAVVDAAGAPAAPITDRARTGRLLRSA